MSPNPPGYDPANDQNFLRINGPYTSQAETARAAARQRLNDYAATTSPGTLDAGKAAAQQRLDSHGSYVQNAAGEQSRDQRAANFIGPIGGGGEYERAQAQQRLTQHGIRQDPKAATPGWDPQLTSPDNKTYWNNALATHVETKNEPWYGEGTSYSVVKGAEGIPIQFDITGSPNIGRIVFNPDRSWTIIPPDPKVQPSVHVPFLMDDISGVPDTNSKFSVPTSDAAVLATNVGMTIGVEGLSKGADTLGRAIQNGANPVARGLYWLYGDQIDAVRPWTQSRVPSTTLPLLSKLEYSRMGGIVAALTIPLSVNSDMQGDDPDSLQRALAREVPAAGVGILTSAAVGAAVGSVVPVAGTAVGFVAGAVAGGLAALAMSKGMNHLLPRFAQGGLASGSGNSTSDDILAWISNGEYVVNAATTSVALPLLQALNAGWVPSPEFLQGMLSGTSSGSPKTLAGSPGARMSQAQSLELRGVAPSAEDDDALLMAALLGAQLGELAGSVLDPQRPAKTLELPSFSAPVKTLELPGPAISQPADSSVPQFKPVQVSPDAVLSSGVGGALSGAQSGAAQHGLVGALTGGISGAASAIGGTLGSAAGTVIGAALGPVGAVLGPVIGQFIGSMAGSKLSEVVTKPIEYAANTAKEVIGSGFGLVDLAKGPGGHTARGDIYNFNGMDPKSAAIAVERVQRRRTLAQQRGGGLGR